MTNTLLQRWVQTWQNYEQTSPETLGAIRNMLFMAVFADLFLVFWYFELKKLALALFVVIIVFLALILLIERRQNNKMMDQLDLDDGTEEVEEEESEDGDEEEVEEEVEEKDAPKKKKKAKKKARETESEPQEQSLGMDIGLPSAAEFEERASKAIGM